MGAILDKPVTAVTRHGGELHSGGFSVPWGLAYMQGFRRTQEDCHIICDSIPELPGCACFAVLDGHGGSFTAVRGAELLLPAFLKEAKAQDLVTAGVAVWKAAFLAADEQLRAAVSVTDHTASSGSTVIAVLITPTHYIIANCGDSRCVLGRAAGLFVTEDHKPSAPGERARIEAAGGFVRGDRVNGTLAVSRSLGDFPLKRASTLPPQAQPVSPEPDVTVLPRDAGDTFLLLACDGVWDVCTNEGAQEFVIGAMSAGATDMCDVASALIEDALRRGSTDNLSAIVLRLPGAPVATPESIALYKEEQERKAAAQKLEDEMALEDPVLCPVLKGDLRDERRWLYVGTRAAASKKSALLAEGINAVLNLAASECENYYESDESFTYMSVPVLNTPDFNILSILPKCVEFLTEQLAADKRVLVHCTDGTSRTCAVVIAYLMHSNRWGVEQGFNFVKLRHAGMFPGPNPGFITQLLEYELLLHPAAAKCDSLPATVDLLGLAEGSLARALLLSKLRMQYLQGAEEAVSAVAGGPATQAAAVPVICDLCDKPFPPSVYQRHRYMHAQQQSRQAQKQRRLQQAGSEEEGGEGEEGKEEAAAVTSPPAADGLLLRPSRRGRL